MSKESQLPCLQLEDDAFDWDNRICNVQKRAAESDSDSEEESEVPVKKKRTKKEKLEQERLEELKIRQVEEELLSLENPKSADQFDRLLLGSPNNSELWIKYMAYYMQAAEYEKVRAVAKRALQTINIREEQEKLNVWIALLNFENLVGTEESLSNCLEEAARVNDDYQVYSKMLDIYVSSKKKQELEKLINRMCKKFRESLECWLHCCECYFNVKEPSKARFLFQRALTSLLKKDHLTFITRFALMENKFGYSEEAQTLFEHVLTSYAGRTDIWSCYVDMLVKMNSIDIARQVLERARAQKLPPKKMKTLYIKSMAFEEKYGNQEKVNRIKKEAERYVGNYGKILDK